MYLYFFKIIILSQVVGIATIACFKYLLKGFGVDFKRWFT